MSKIYVDELHPKTSGKYIVMPEKPAFSVGITASITHTSSSTSPIPYNKTDDVFFNRGSHYDTSTYKFTAPVDGVYYFAGRVSFATAEVSRYANLGVLLNGSATVSEIVNRDAMGSTASSSTYQGLGGTYLLDLSKGDTVSLFSSWDATNNTFDSSETIHVHGTWFQGFLVG